MVQNYNDTNLIGIMIQSKRKKISLYDDTWKLKEKQLMKFY